jgi:NADP-dependent 3-hydroxy acid dehydrogenase YdfG
MPPPDLEGRVVLITGASSGVGAAAARALVAAGARVVLGARRTDRLDALRSELGRDVAVAAHTDVTVAAHVARLVAVGRRHFGRLDAVFANAGVGPGGPLMGPGEDRWAQMLSTNVLGVAYTIRYGAEAILDTAGSGDVIVNSSIVGRRVTPGNPMYTASKFAASALAAATRLELEPRLRVTVFETAAVETEFPRRPGEPRLPASDVAAAVVQCLSSPPGAALEEIVMSAAGTSPTVSDADRSTRTTRSQA